MKYSLLNKHNSNAAPKSNVTTRTAGIKNTYCRDTVFSNETDEPKMTKAQCNLRRRCGCLQRVRDGEWGVVAPDPIKTKNKTKRNSSSWNIPYWIKQLKFSTQKQRHDKNSLHQKTLTVEIQYFQMRQMNQRWRKRNATFRADAVVCNVWGMESEEWWRRTQSKQKTKSKQTAAHEIFPAG